MNPEILVEVTRGGLVESVHRGSIVIVNGDGETQHSVGDPATITFTRSSVKAFQALPFLTSGAADVFGFSEMEIALACASHSGEDFHIKAVLAMLEKAGLTEEDLGCGGHPPFSEEAANALIRGGITPGPVFNNCSGKHTAMLAVAKHIGADTGSYLSSDSPVQKRILEAVSLFSGVSPDEIGIGTDGCSAPNFALPLSAMARAFARLIHPDGSVGKKSAMAARRIVLSMMRFPEYVGGTRRLDTIVMKALKGKVVCKVGAEGVWLAGVMPNDTWSEGLAIALKIEDGNDHRARPVVGIEILRKLGVVDAAAEKTLAEFSPMSIINRNGKKVGKASACFRLP